MKKVAIANSKSALQRATVKDVTKNVLISWGILKRSEDGNVYPTNAYVYLTGQDGLRSESIFIEVRMGSMTSIMTPLPSKLKSKLDWK